jgi:hypothetical protein
MIIRKVNLLHDHEEGEPSTVNGRGPGETRGGRGGRVVVSAACLLLTWLWYLLFLFAHI